MPNKEFYHRQIKEALIYGTSAVRVCADGTIKRINIYQKPKWYQRLWYYIRKKLGLIKPVRLTIHDPEEIKWLEEMLKQGAEHGEP